MARKLTPAAVEDAGNGRTPLAAVIEALRKAEARGELSPNETEWSIARLSGKVKAGNPRVEGVDRRDSIVRAAIAVFGREGYNRATIEMIANELLLTKTSIYHYFKSKTDILDAICERASVASTSGTIESARAGGDPPARLRRMLAAYATACLSEPGFGVLMRHLDEVSPPVLASVTRNGKRVERALSETIEEGIGDGVFAAPDARIAAFGMLGAINYTYAWYRSEGRLKSDMICDALVALLVDGISVRGRATSR